MEPNHPLPEALIAGSGEVADRTLVARAQMGVDSSFEELVRRHQQKIYGLCYHLTSNHEDATDLAQDAFVKAWKALKSFKGDSSFCLLYTSDAADE